MKGICFIEPLFPKVVKGEKIHTRRLIKPQPDDSGLWNDDLYPRALDSTLTGFNGTVDETGESKEFKPKYKVGEMVYLKEPYKLIDISGFWFLEYMFGGGGAIVPDPVGIIELEKLMIKQKKSKSGWLNKLFMPEWAARHFIKIEDVEAERLQDISNEDCRKEGVNICKGCIERGCVMGVSCTWPINEYKTLFDKINGKGTWEKNPFVWVYNFKLIK